MIFHELSELECTRQESYGVTIFGGTKYTSYKSIQLTENIFPIFVKFEQRLQKITSKCIDY